MLFQKTWHTLNPWTYILIVFVIFNILLNVVVLPWIANGITSDAQNEPEIHSTVLYHSKRALFAQYQKSDSWLPMSLALANLPNSSQESIYEIILKTYKIKFQYPLTSLFILPIIDKISVASCQLAHTLPISVSKVSCKSDGLELSGGAYRVAPGRLKVLKFISWGFLLLTIVFSIRIYLANLKQIALEVGTQEKFFQIFLLFILGITYYPLVKGYTLGQVQVWIDAFFTLLIWNWMRKKEGISGFWAGLICLLKPQFILLLLWGLLRRRWKFSAVFAFTTTFGFSISLVYFGLKENLSYIRFLSLIGRTGEAFYANQSVNGTLNRLIGNGLNLEWQLDFPSYQPMVYYGTLISSLILLLMALILPVRNFYKGRTVDLMIMAVTCTMASPIAWEHHYGILLPVFAYLLPQLIGVRGWVPYVLLGVSYFLCSNYFDFLKATALTPWNLFQSYLLFGAFLLLIFLYRISSVREFRIAKEH